jgi:RimJ/RimL family protein N-acetyltransferase
LKTAAGSFSLFLGLPVRGTTLPTNQRSRHVMAKLGFQYETDVERAGLPHV